MSATTRPAVIPPRLTWSAPSAAGGGSTPWARIAGCSTGRGGRCLDAQLFDSGLAAEDDQWAWLAAQLGARPVDGSIALVLHKPLTAPAPELAAAPPYRFVPPTARRRLDDLLAGRRVPLVLSGHVHQFRVIETAARRHVWVPTTWAVLPDHVQPVFGAKRCGVVSVTLGPDGQAPVTLVEPAGLAQLTLTRDIPDPYAA